MNAKAQIAMGIAAAILLGVLDKLLPDSGIVLLAVVSGLVLASLFGGQRLPLIVRVVATIATFYAGYRLCLIGRTMEPGFTGYTVMMAVFFFGLGATVPALSLLHIWQGRLRIVLIASVFPLSLVGAFAVAAYEEHQFIRQHRDGIGPTARWTVSNHWLAYDAETQRLSGSD